MHARIFWKRRSKQHLDHLSTLGIRLWSGKLALFQRMDWQKVSQSGRADDEPVGVDCQCTIGMTLRSLVERRLERNVMNASVLIPVIPTTVVMATGDFGAVWSWPQVISE